MSHAVKIYDTCIGCTQVCVPALCGLDGALGGRPDCLFASH